MKDKQDKRAQHEQVKRAQHVRGAWEDNNIFLLIFEGKNRHVGRVLPCHSIEEADIVRRQLGMTAWICKPYLMNKEQE